LAETSVGHITSVVSNDLGRFDRGLDLIYLALITPIQIVVGIIIIWQYVGASVLPAFFLMVLLALLTGNSSFTKLISIATNITIH